MWNQSEVSSVNNSFESKKIGWVYDIILDENNEWELHKRYTNNNGLTILKRIK